MCVFFGMSLALLISYSVQLWGYFRALQQNTCIHLLYFSFFPIQYLIKWTDLLYLAKCRGLFLIKVHKSSERAGTQEFQSCFRDEKTARHIMHMFCCTIEDVEHEGSFEWMHFVIN
jgi:hypothetical protein